MRKLRFRAACGLPRGAGSLSGTVSLRRGTLYSVSSLCGALCLLGRCSAPGNRRNARWTWHPACPVLRVANFLDVGFVCLVYLAPERDPRREAGRRPDKGDSVNFWSLIGAMPLAATFACLMVLLTGSARHTRARHRDTDALRHGEPAIGEHP